MKTLVLAGALCVSVAMFAQARNAHWVVGDSIHLNFSSGSPVVEPLVPVVTGEGQGVISDVEGNLLFVANHGAIVNALYDTLPNGYGAFTTDTYGTVTQNSLILPKPSSVTKYHAVYLHSDYTDYWPRAECLIVDLDLAGGLGDVVPGSHWIFSDSLTEKLTGAPHANGVDYWVLLHEWDTDEFHAHLVDTDGLDTVPVISHAGSPHTRFSAVPNFQYNFQGQMKLDLAGEWIALTNPNSSPPQDPHWSVVQLFAFDASSGQVEYMMNFPGHKRSYGIEFSPDASKLYVSGWDSLYHYVDQYDLSLPDTTAIEGSRSRVYEYYHGGGFENAVDRPHGMATGPDGRIYVTRGFAPDPWFAIIDQPNAAGLGCNFIWNGLDLGVGNYQFGHCNQLKRYHDSEFNVGLHPPAPRPGLNLWPNPMETYAWLDGVAARGAVQVRWRDAAGRVVWDEQVYGNGFGVLLVVGELSGGVYTVELLHGGDRLGVVRAVVRR